VQVGVRVGIQDLISVVGSPCGNVGSWEWGRESMRWSKGPGIACENLQGSRRVLELLATVCVGVEKSQN
jgi:hypothetical protein